MPILLKKDKICQTGADHGWPKMLISVPTLGKRYGQCVLGPSDDLKKGEGKIQLDIVAEVGLELVSPRTK